MHGITESYLQHVKNVYTNNARKIKIGDRLSDTLYPNQGVRQGFILSILLFNIFLANLPKLLRPVGV